MSKKKDKKSKISIKLSSFIFFLGFFLFPLFCFCLDCGQPVALKGTLYIKAPGMKDLYRFIEKRFKGSLSFVCYKTGLPGSLSFKTGDAGTSIKVNGELLEDSLAGRLYALLFVFSHPYGCEEFMEEKNHFLKDGFEVAAGIFAAGPAKGSYIDIRKDQRLVLRRLYGSGIDTEIYYKNYKKEGVFLIPYTIYGHARIRRREAEIVKHYESVECMIDNGT